jgi:hypothetical protein
MPILYHLANLERAESIDANGFVDEAGTYKQTGMDLDGVFFSEKERDSNEDDLGSIVYAIELDETQIAMYEIIEAEASHRSYSLPCALANSVPRRRLSASEAQSVPLVDRAHDPAYPPATP